MATATVVDDQGGRGHPSFVAAGAGGQYIQVISDLDLVVVITTDTDQDRSDPQFLIEGTIVSAITH
jgi:MinD superfamily P-loop ATPase